MIVIGIFCMIFIVIYGLIDWMIGLITKDLEKNVKEFEKSLERDINEEL